jgi:hypothetical protein
MRTPSSGESVHVGVGLSLFAIGSGGVLTLLITAAATAARPPLVDRWWFWLLLALSLCEIAAGIYLVVATYTALPLPRTWLERQLEPKLILRRIAFMRTFGNSVLFEVGVENQGLVDVDLDFYRSDEFGLKSTDGSTSVTSEELEGGTASTYWNQGDMKFPARTARPLYFYAVLPELRSFPVKVKLWSENLGNPVVGEAEVKVPTA